LIAVIIALPLILVFDVNSVFPYTLISLNFNDFQGDKNEK